MPDLSPSTLVVGLGNPILTDDGAGIHVVRAVRARSDGGPMAGSPAGIVFAEASVGGLRLLERIAGYDRVILVDAIQTPDGMPGDICRLSARDLRSSLHAGSTHDLSFQGALAWGRQNGIRLPADEDIQIVAIEARDVLTFGESCTPAVAAAIPRAVELVLSILGARQEPEA